MEFIANNGVSTIKFQAESEEKAKEYLKELPDYKLVEDFIFNPVGDIASMDGYAEKYFPNSCLIIIGKEYKEVVEKFIKTLNAT